jgi:hypothetical protein
MKTKTQPEITTLQEVLGACMVVGAVLFFSLFGVLRFLVWAGSLLVRAGRMAKFYK